MAKSLEQEFAEKHAGAEVTILGFTGSGRVVGWSHSKFWTGIDFVLVEVGTIAFRYIASNDWDPTCMSSTVTWPIDRVIIVGVRDIATLTAPSVGLSYLSPPVISQSFNPKDYPHKCLCASSAYISPVTGKVSCTNRSCKNVCTRLK